METELSRWQLAYETISTLMTSVTSSGTVANWTPLLLNYPIDANDMYVPLLCGQGSLRGPERRGTQFQASENNSARRGRVTQCDLRTPAGSGRVRTNVRSTGEEFIAANCNSRTNDLQSHSSNGSNSRHAASYSNHNWGHRPRSTQRTNQIGPVNSAPSNVAFGNSRFVPLSNCSEEKLTDDRPISRNGVMQAPYSGCSSRSTIPEHMPDRPTHGSSLLSEFVDAQQRPATRASQNCLSTSSANICQLFQRLLKNFYTETFLWIYANTLLHPGSRRILNRIRFLAVETGRPLQQAVFDMLTGFLSGYQHSRVPLLSEIEHSLRQISVQNIRQHSPSEPDSQATNEEIERSIRLRQLSLELGAALNPRQMLRSFGTVVREVTMHTIASPGVHRTRFCQQIRNQNSQTFGHNSFSPASSTSNSEGSSSNHDRPWQLIPPPPPPYPGFLLHFLAMLDQPALPSDVPEYYGIDDSEESYEILSELAEQLGDAKHSGLTDLDLQQFPVYQFKLSDQMSLSNQDTCIICIERYEIGQNLRLLPCGHDYHNICIDKWLKVKNSCPVCRSHLSFGA